MWVRVGVGAILLIAAGGFVVGALDKPQYTPFCTKKACFPPHGTTGRQEIPCNDCWTADYTFYTGVLNFGEHCSGKEILVFDDGNAVVDYGERIDSEECRYRWTSEFVYLVHDIRYNVWALFFQGEEINSRSVPEQSGN